MSEIEHRNSFQQNFEDLRKSSPIPQGTPSKHYIKKYQKHKQIKDYAVIFSQQDENIDNSKDLDYNQSCHNACYNVQQNEQEEENNQEIQENTKLNNSKEKIKTTQKPKLSRHQLRKKNNELKSLLQRVAHALVAQIDKTKRANQENTYLNQELVELKQQLALSRENLVPYQLERLSERNDEVEIMKQKLVESETKALRLANLLQSALERLKIMKSKQKELNQNLPQGSSVCSQTQLFEFADPSIQFLNNKEEKILSYKQPILNNSSINNQNIKKENIQQTQINQKGEEKKKLYNYTNIFNQNQMNSQKLSENFQQTQSEKHAFRQHPTISQYSPQQNNQSSSLNTQTVNRASQTMDDIIINQTFDYENHTNSDANTFPKSNSQSPFNFTHQRKHNNSNDSQISYFSSPAYDQDDNQINITNMNKQDLYKENKWNKIKNKDNIRHNQKKEDVQQTKSPRIQILMTEGLDEGILNSDQKVLIQRALLMSETFSDYWLRTPQSKKKKQIKHNKKENEREWSEQYSYERSSSSEASSQCQSMNTYQINSNNSKPVEGKYQSNHSHYNKREQQDEELESMNPIRVKHNKKQDNNLKSSIINQRKLINKNPRLINTTTQSSAEKKTPNQIAMIQNQLKLEGSSARGVRNPWSNTTRITSSPITWIPPRSFTPPAKRLEDQKADQQQRRK